MVASNDVDTALAALDADALRDLIRELLRGADERLHDWLLDRLVERAARSGAAWNPEGPTSEAVRWLREVIERMEGAAGLENLARATGRVGDLQAWCRALASAEDWRAALVACEDATAIVAGDTHAVAQFLDGGALVARNLGRRDLPARLERAWRADPTLVRLLRLRERFRRYPAFQRELANQLAE